MAVNLDDPNTFVGPQTPDDLPAMPGGSGMGSLGGFLNSPGGAAAINAAGAGLSAYGQARSESANRQQNAYQFAAQTRQNQYQQDQANSINRASGVLNADPLGADQRYAQRNAIMAAILPNLRNFHTTPGDAGIAGAMRGTTRGGIMNALGPNGLDPAMVSSLFGPNATMASIGQRHKELNNLDPNAPLPDMGSMFGPEAAPYMGQMREWAQNVQQMNAQQRAQFDQDMKGYIDHMVQQEAAQGNGSGFWHKFAKIAGMVGAVAATVMTGGAASPLMVGALGAGSAAASAWGSGAGAGGTVLAGAMGGAAPLAKAIKGTGQNNGSE